MQRISAGRYRCTTLLITGVKPFRLLSAYKPNARSLERHPPGASGRALHSRLLMASKADLDSIPGVSQPDAATKDFIFQQTMYRIKDPKRSLDFYTRIMGFRLIEKLDFPDSKFSLYFLGYHSADAVPRDPKERVVWMFKQPATLELTHNWGTESDDNAKMHSGNEEPKGYGHIGFHVPDVDKACQRFEDLGVEFVKKPNAGNMKGLAFIKDPDGYWIEILNGDNSKQFV